MARTKQTARKSSGGNLPIPRPGGTIGPATEPDPTRGGTRLPHPSSFRSGEAFMAALFEFPALFRMLRDDVHIEPLVAELPESDRDDMRRRLAEKRALSKEMHRRRCDPGNTPTAFEAPPTAFAAPPTAIAAPPTAFAAMEADVSPIRKRRRPH